MPLGRALLSGVLLWGMPLVKTEAERTKIENERLATLDLLPERVRTALQERHQSVSAPLPPPPAPDRVEVPLKKLGDEYGVEARINNTITMTFALDTGVSDVSLPEDTVITLARAGAIDKADLIGPETYVLADGTEIESVTFVIRELRVGGYGVANVRANIGTADSDGLLGQSFLRKFRSWSVDHDRELLILSR